MRRYGKQARQDEHDRVQASRRTAAQNKALIELINSVKPVEGQTWGFTDVPPDGGSFEVSHPRTGRTWTIEQDGKVTKVDDV